MQHVGVGEQVIGVGTGPGPHPRAGVSVQGGGPDAGQAEPLDRGELIGGQGLGRRDVQRRPALQDPGQGRQQVAERFPGGGARRDDHIPAGACVIGRRDLVGPRRADPAPPQRRGDLGRDPVRPGRPGRRPAPGSARDGAAARSAGLPAACGGRGPPRARAPPDGPPAAPGAARRGRIPVRPSPGPAAAGQAARGSCSGRGSLGRGVIEATVFSASSVVAACPAPGFRIDMTPERG